MKCLLWKGLLHILSLSLPPISVCKGKCACVLVCASVWVSLCVCHVYENSWARVTVHMWKSENNLRYQSLKHHCLSWLPHHGFPDHLTGTFCYVSLLWVSSLRTPEASKALKSRFQLETPKSIISYLSKLQEMKSKWSGHQEQWAWIRWSLFRQFVFQQISRNL